MKQVIKFVRDALKRHPGSTFDKDIQKMRQMALKEGLQINPVGAGDRKTALPGSWRNVGITNGSCAPGCQFLPKEEGGNGDCYVLKGDKTAMSNKRATPELERSLMSAAIAMLAAADKGEVARLHVAGDFFRGGRIDYRYITGLRRISQIIRSHYKQDVVGYTYCHDASVEHFAKYKAALRRNGIRVRNSDHNIPDGAIIWEHDKMDALRIAFPENKYVKCLYQVNKEKTCVKCRMCWDEKYEGCVVVFHPDNSSTLKRQPSRSLPVLQ